MASRKRTVRPKSSLTAQEVEKKVAAGVEAAEGIVKTLTEGAFDVAKLVTDRLDKAADKAFEAAEKIVGERSTSARRVYRTLSENRDRGIELARKQTKKWVNTVSEIIG